MLSRVMENTSCYNINGDMLRKVTVKIRLESINTQEEVIVKVLLDSGMIDLVMSLEFVKKQRFKFKKTERQIYVKNIDRIFNKKRPIENTIKVNIYYQKYRERTEIDIISSQKWSMILGMLQIVCYNSEIDWRTGEVKMTRCLEECRKQ